MIKSKRIVFVLIAFIVLNVSCLDRSPTNIYEPYPASMDWELSLAQPIKKDSVIVIPEFESTYVDNRSVEIWLPKGYPKAGIKYNVLYMQDGQNVFNSENSHYGKSWLLGPIMDSLYTHKLIEPTIVVAPWSNPEKRFNEYMPKQPSSLTDNSLAKNELKKITGYDELLSDQYLLFLTQELKPFVDVHFNTDTSAQSTAVMGSSMGGLISLYATIKYPEVFSKAGCMSTHWSLPILGEAFINTLEISIPSHQNTKYYFDYGTETVDKDYEPYQKKVDSIFSRRGYTASNYKSLKFEGHEHSEEYWSKRVDQALIYLLKKQPQQ